MKPLFDLTNVSSFTNVFFLSYLLANELRPVVLAELGYVPESFDAPFEDAALAVVVSGKILEEEKIIL